MTNVVHGNCAPLIRMNIMSIKFAIPIVLAIKVALLVSSSSSPQNIALLSSDFFASKNIRKVVLFVCRNNEGVWLLRKMAENAGRQTSVRLQEEGAVHVLLGQHAVGVVVLLDCPEAFRFLEECSTHLLFNSSFHWLLVSEKTNFSFEKMNRLQLDADSEVTFARRSDGETSDQWDFLDAYRLHPTLDIQTRAMGRWSISNLQRVSPSWSLPIPIRRPDIGGLPIRTLISLPVNLTQKQLDDLQYISKEEALKIQQSLFFYTHIITSNVWPIFNMTVVVSSKPTPGEIAPDANGSFHGAIGALQRGEGDFFSSALMLPSRMSALDYTIPVWNFRSMFVFLNPSVLGSVDALVKPLHWSTWVGVLLACGAAVILYRIVTCRNGLDEDDSWGKALITTVGILSGNGSQPGPSSTSTRILLYTFQIFCLLVINYYSSSIVTFLLSPTPTTIHTVKDMMKSPLRGISHDWYHQVRVLTKSNDPIIQEVYNKFVKPPRGLGFQPLPACVSNLRHSLVAVYAQDVEIYEEAKMLPNNELCRLREVSVLPDQFISPSAGKHVTVKEYMRLGLVRQLERGVLKRLLGVWREPKPACNHGTNRESTKGIGMRPIAPALVMFLIGIFLSCCICIAERIRWRIYIRNYNQRSGIILPRV